ncbi:hypothetical protein CRM22_010621 [Opisthorchis felineus]|uniref:Vacuolar protein sorting-associated protein 18 homolog n=1 Tax=Opisthorchis felineus TaxID=147828 RepID=A0A4S2KRE5_OPIFE|nr:hypothetical protein CRM22_010621 [Opisthorchis felineus]
MQKQTSEKSEEGSSAEFFSRDGIFHLEPLQTFRPTAPLTNFQVSGSFLIAATVKNTLLRLSVASSSKLSEIEISRVSDDRVHNLFLDPMGWHTIISMQSGMNFYTNRGMKKVRPIIKSKELLFDSVAWNQHNANESSTQEILIGTNDGLIFETILTSDEGRFIANTTEQYWRQVANLGHSVTGLEVVRHPPGSASVLVGEPQRCVILATTPSRLYQFAGWINTSSTTTLLSQLGSGSPTSSTGMHLSANLGLPAVNDYPQPSGVSSTPTLFPNYAPGLYYNVFNPEDKLPAGSKVTEFPHSFGYSDLKLYKFPGDELPSRFAWMTGPGIYFGHLKTEQLNLPPFSMPPSEVGAADSSLSAVEDPTDRLSNRVTTNGQNTTQPRDVFAGRVVNLFRKTKLLPYPVIRMLEHTGVPLGICLTAFHVIVAYADRVKAVNILDDQTVFSMPITPELNGGRALGVCRDPSSGSVWFFSNQGVARLNIRNETCRVWQIYLDRMLFDEARKFCQTESQLDSVNMREAEHCFSHGDFMNSAKLFARTSVPFEEVALRFSQLSLMQQQASRSSSPPVLQGLAVRDDHDVMDAIIHGSDEAKKSSKLSLLNGSKSATELTISASAPLKTLVSTKLQQLIEQKSVPLTGNAGIPSAKQSGPNKDISGQITLLSLWLAELLITEISFFRDRVEKQDSSQDGSRLETASEEFRRLLATPEVLAILPDAKDLLYDLIESHGIDAEIVFLAELLGDHPRLVNHYMRLGMHKDALRTLGASSRCISLVYDYATTLALSCPEDVVTVWLRLGKLLDPVKLLPAIMLLPPKHAMRYLQTAVDRYGCTDQAVHHLLISLCAEASSPLSNQAPESADSKDYLMSYLESTSAHALNMVDAAGHSQFSLQELMSTTLSSEASDEPSSLLMGFDTSFMQSSLPYDPGFVLRTCKETGHLQGTVFILKLLGMHQQALQTAIDSDNIPLAKAIAQNEALNVETRRQLWMIIARHVIGKQSNMQEATSLLRECPLLKLEDLLPYFHDFVTIDQFKDAICASLDSYHQRIGEVKREMHVTMRSTNALRKQLDTLRYRYEELDVANRCVHCKHILLLRAFYVFPCGHQFHMNCLIHLIQPLLTAEEKTELNDLLRMQQQGVCASSVDLQNKLDHIIASDCVSCGQPAIAGVSRLFFPDQTSYEAEVAVWQ